MHTLFTLFALLILGTQTSWSASYNRSNMEWSRLISVSNGTASPSYMTAVFENPAGLVYNSNLKFVASASTADTSGSFRPLGMGAQIYGGSGTVGATLGAFTSVNNVNGSAFSQNISVPLGVAASTGSFAFGLAGTYISSGSSVITGATSFNAGMITAVNPTTYWGLQAYNVFGGLSGWGTGFAFDISNSATFAVDGAVDRNLRGLALKPGLVANVKPFQLALSYGFTLDNSGAAPLSTGASFGLGIEAGQTLHWQFYYNQLSELYLALAMRL